jgi:hypothetical protein
MLRPLEAGGGLLRPLEAGGGLLRPLEAGGGLLRPLACPPPPLLSPSFSSWYQGKFFGL